MKLPAAEIIDKRAQGISDKIGFVIPGPWAAGVWETVDRAYRKKITQLCIELSLPHRPRSTGERSQNHHFNGHLQQICVETGNDFGQLKLWIKRRAFTRGYPMKIDDGNIVLSIVDGEPLPKSEADASVEECALLIEEVHQVAAEADIILQEE